MKKGFTLAEVLITLVIIGVIAAITVPTLMANHQKEETAAKLKKFYSTLSQAVRLAEFENPGFVKSTHSQRYEDIENWWNDNLGKYMPVTKTSQTYTRTGTDGNSDYSNVYALNDGSLIVAVDNWGDGTVYLHYDINGYKAPNRRGKDIFKFTMQSFQYKSGGIKSTTAVCTGDDCGAWHTKNGVYVYPDITCNYSASVCDNEQGGSCARYIQCNGWKL